MTARRLGGHTDGDTGLGLVEVIVAMLVLTVALLALVPVQTRALAGVVLSEERQQATGYATRAIEQMRATVMEPATDAKLSGYDRVAAGRWPSLFDPDDWVHVASCSSQSAACRFAPSFDPSFSPEPLRGPWPVWDVDDSLRTEWCSEQSTCSTSPSTSNLTFATRLYVTDTGTSQTTATGRPALINVTAVTTWTSRNSTAGTHRIAVRTQVASPTGSS